MPSNIFHKPEEGFYGYKANRTFAQLHTDKNPYLFVRGPVGSGKSTGCVMHVFMNAIKQKPDYKGVRKSRYMIVRATYPSLKTTIVKTWLEYFGDFLKITYDTPFKGLLQLELPDGTSIRMELNFLAVATEEDIEKLQSYEVTGVHVNEGHEIDPSVLRMLKSRYGRYPAMRDGGPVDPFILLDYNSVDTEHWLYEMAEVVPDDPPPGMYDDGGKLKKHTFYVQPPAMIEINGQLVVNRGQDPNVPAADNVENLRDDYYTDMVAGNDPDWVNVYILNNYGQVRSGKPVYKEYTDDVHSATQFLKPLHGVPLIIGVDQGLTPAAAFCQLSPTGELLILDEIVTEDCSLREFCEDHLKPKLVNKFKKFANNYTIVIDPAALQRSQNDAKAGVEMFREAGLNYKIARTNAVAQRREAVVYFLRRRNGLLLSPACRYLRKGFISEYKYEELRGSSAGMFKERPAKNIYSHVHDALQYAALELNIPKRKKNFKRSTRQVASAVGGY
jgi:hypothetical protein